MLEHLLKQNRDNRTESFQRFVEVNRRMPAVPGREPVEIEYDPDEDYLWIQVGKAVNPITAFITPDGMAVIVEADSYEFRGLECPFFLEKDERGAFTKKSGWHGTAEIIRNGHHLIYIPPKRESDAVYKGFGHLVPA